ncbi:unnamed protein product [Boreogadus saida]
MPSFCIVGTYFYAFRSTQCSLMSSPVGVAMAICLLPVTFEERASIETDRSPQDTLRTEAVGRYELLFRIRQICPVFSPPPSLPTDTHGDPLRALFLALSSWRRSGLSPHPIVSAKSQFVSQAR